MQPSEVKSIYGRKGREAALEAYGTVLAENPGSSEELAFIAADFAHPEALAILFDAGASPMVADKYEFTLLHYLARCPESTYVAKPKGAVKATAELLLDNKVSAIRKDKNENMTCYHYAARNGMAEMIDALAGRGAKLNMTDKNGNTGIHIACDHIRHALHNAEYKMKNLEQALKKREETTARLKSQGKTDEEVAQYHADDKFSKLENAQKEYDAAVEQIEGYYLTVKAFAEAGVDIDEKNEAGRSALDIAVANNAKKIAAYLSGTLIDSADGSALTIGGMTLHQAAEKGDVEAIKAIAATGADLNLPEDNDRKKFGGCTPLAVACACLQAGAAEALLSCGADPAYKDGNGRAAVSYLTPDISKEKKVSKIIKDLVSAGMGIDLLVNDDGDTLLVMACRSNSHVSLKKDILDTVLRLNPNINIPNRFGETALMHACAKDFEIMENIQIDILERGADALPADNKGDTALHYAARNGSKAGAKALCEMLLEFGADASAVNDAGQTALDIATKEDNEPLVKLLLSKL